MADGYSEASEGEQDAEYASSRQRVMAGIWDGAFVGVFTILLFITFGLPMPTGDIWSLLFFLVVFGIIHLVLAGIFESSRSRTIGKYIEGIEVFSLRGGDVSGGQAFGRNISKIFILFYLLDIILAGSSAQPTQKASDKSLDTVLIKSRPTYIRRPRRHHVRVDREEGDSGLDDEEARRLEMIDYLRHGKCRVCGSPFRILEKGDTSFSGLWNSRCTWCNTLVFEEDSGVRKVEPGFKPDSGYTRYRTRGFRDWERGSYDAWERERGDGGDAGPRRRTEPGFKP